MYDFKKHLKTHQNIRSGMLSIFTPFSSPDRRDYFSPGYTQYAQNIGMSMVAAQKILAQKIQPTTNGQDKKLKRS